MEEIKEFKMSEIKEISSNGAFPSSFRNKISNAKETFFSWSKSVDINCYTKMLDYGGNYFVQFIWLMILLGSTGATFYLIAYSIIGYLKYEVTSQIRIVNELPTQFPTVTFCDNNPFSTLYAEEFMDDIYLNLNEPDSDILFNLAKYHASSKLITNDDRQTFITPIYNGCTFKKRDCSNDLHWYWSYEYGNCYQFNSGYNMSDDKIDLVNVTREGKDFGVTLSWLPILNENSYVTTRARGLVVFVHNSSFKPSEAFFVESGKMTYIAVKRKVTQKYPFPYSDCIDLETYKSDLFDYMKKSNKTYRKQDCFELCIQKTIIDTCQCYYTKYDDLGTNVTACLNVYESNCLEDKISNFNLENCQTNSCPLECDSFSYDLSFSSLEYSDESSFMLESKNPDILDVYNDTNLTLSYDTYKSNLALFTVYYPSLKYEQISESPKTQIIDLFTQIGGALGMFVSFSIFTIFELIEIVLLILKDILIKPKTKISTIH
jgi:hypothetical protein